MAKCPTASSSLPNMSRPRSDRADDPRQTKSDTDIDDKNISPEVHQLMYQRLLRRIPSVLINQWPHVSWRDVKEIVFPKCSASDCEIVLSSMKVLFKYPYEKSMIKCDRESQRMFAMKGHIVPLKSFLVNLNILEDSILNLHYAVKTKHRYAKPRSSIQRQCKYTMDHVKTFGNKCTLSNNNDPRKDDKATDSKIAEVTHKGIKYPVLVRMDHSSRTEIFVPVNDLLSKSSRICPILQKACLLFINNQENKEKNLDTVLSSPSPLEANELMKKKQRLGQLDRKDQSWRFMTSQSVLIKRTHLLTIHNEVNTNGFKMDSVAMTDCLKKWFGTADTNRKPDSENPVDGNTGDGTQMQNDARSKWSSPERIDLITNIEQGIPGVVLSVIDKGSVNANGVNAHTGIIRASENGTKPRDQNKSLSSQKKNKVIGGQAEDTPIYPRIRNGAVLPKHIIPIHQLEKEENRTKAHGSKLSPLDKGEMGVTNKYNNVMLKQGIANGQDIKITTEGNHKNDEKRDMKVFIGARYDTNTYGQVEIIPYSKNYKGNTNVKDGQRTEKKHKVKPSKKKIWRHDIRKVLRSLELENICKSFENDTVKDTPNDAEKIPHFPIIQREEIRDKGNVYYKLGQRPSPMKSKTKMKHTKMSDINKENNHECEKIDLDAKERRKGVLRTPFGTRLENILYPRKCVEDGIHQVVAIVYDNVTKDKANNSKQNDSIKSISDNDSKNEANIYERTNPNVTVIPNNGKGAETNNDLTGTGSGEHVLAQSTSKPIFPAVDGSGDFIQVLKEFSIRPTHSMNSMRSLICGLENDSITIEKKSSSLLKIVDTSDDGLDKVDGVKEGGQFFEFEHSNYATTDASSPANDKCQDTERLTEQKINVCGKGTENNTSNRPLGPESFNVADHIKEDDDVKLEPHVHWKKRIYKSQVDSPAKGNLQPYRPNARPKASEASTTTITPVDTQQIDDCDSDGELPSQNSITKIKQSNDPKYSVDINEQLESSQHDLIENEHADIIDEREETKENADMVNVVLEKSQEVIDTEEQTIKIVSCCSLANDKHLLNMWEKCENDQPNLQDGVTDNQYQLPIGTTSHLHIDDLQQDECISQVNSEGSPFACECDWTSPMVFIENVSEESNREARCDYISTSIDPSSDILNENYPTSKSSSNVTIDVTYDNDDEIIEIENATYTHETKTNDVTLSRRTDDPRVLCSEESRAKQALLFKQLSALGKKKTTRPSGRPAMGIKSTSSDMFKNHRGTYGAESSKDITMHGLFIDDLRYTEIADPTSGLTTKGYTYKNLDVSIPFTVKFGYKYALVQDVHQLFPQCGARCPLVRSVVKKYKGLAATICDWDDVRNFDLIRDRMTQTGDILVRIDLLLKQGVDLYKDISSKHQRQTKIAQGCKQCKF
ncbi:unnamed protein product [Owenia fusiformis]|uniref:Uncharacterized protein n=1 Tax=Owenia fusiformis TaxID=6347 RepID=A0A8S4N351_OWEFU|nr:unnamed protein product [Owenia fusiformis]